MNLSNLIYMLVGAFSGLATIFLTRRLITNNSTLSLVTVLVITLAMGLTKVYLIPYYRATTYVSFIKNDDPVIDLISTQYPTLFNTYIHNVKKSLLAHESKDVVLLYKVDLLNEVFALTLMKASNASIYNYYKTELDLYKNLYAIDPKLVLFLEFSGQFAHKPNPTLIITLGGGDDMMQQLITAKENIVTNAINHPQPILTNSQNTQAGEMIAAIFAKIATDFGDQTFTNVTTKPDDPSVDPRTAALLVISFYGDILATGEDKAGMIFKYLNTPQTVKEAPH
jgi:hypothetical protein